MYCTYLKEGVTAEQAVAILHAIEATVAEAREKVWEFAKDES
jgi:hypothetical protein